MQTRHIIWSYIFQYITSAYNRVEFGGHTYVIMMEDVLMDEGEYVEMVAAVYILV